MTPSPRDRAQAAARRDATFARLGRMRKVSLVGAAALTALFTGVVAAATPGKRAPRTAVLAPAHPSARTRRATVHHRRHLHRAVTAPATTATATVNGVTATATAPPTDASPQSVPDAQQSAPAPPPVVQAPAPVAPGSVAPPVATSGGS